MATIWETEPDTLDFIDDATGLPCHMHRHPRMGHWCGYIGVPAGHSWHGKGYSDQVKTPSGILERQCNIDELGVVNVFCAAHRIPDDWSSAPIDVLVRCHGGLTFADKPYWPDEKRADWWFGFDCSHAGDLTPRLSFHDGDIYRDVNYVKAACIKACADIHAAIAEQQSAA